MASESEVKQRWTEARAIAHRIHRAAERGHLDAITATDAVALAERVILVGQWQDEQEEAEEGVGA